MAGSGRELVPYHPPVPAVAERPAPPAARRGPGDRAPRDRRRPGRLPDRILRGLLVDLSA